MDAHIIVYFPNVNKILSQETLDKIEWKQLNIPCVHDNLNPIKPINRLYPQSFQCWRKEWQVCFAIHLYASKEKINWEILQISSLSGAS